MLPSASQYSLNFHLLFNKERIISETETKIDFISSIWDDDNILRLDKNNLQCLWCTNVVQVINDTKALAHVMGKKGMYTKSCCVTKIKSHITRY